MYVHAVQALVYNVVEHTDDIKKQMGKKTTFR